MVFMLYESYVLVSIGLYVTVSVAYDGKSKHAHKMKIEDFDMNTK